MTIHAWAELPKHLNQPEYLTVSSDAKGFYLNYHYSDPPSHKTTTHKSLAVAMTKFAFELSGYYPLPSFDEIFGQTKRRNCLDKKSFHIECTRDSVTNLPHSNLRRRSGAAYSPCRRGGCA